MSVIARLRGVIQGDDAVERIVPSTGLTVWLVVATAAAMAALATAMLIAWITLGRTVEVWSDDLARSATVVIDGPLERREVETEAALTALLRVPGVTRAEVVDRAAQAELLAPWLGDLAQDEALPLPTLVLVEQSGADPGEIALALAPVAPGASYADHGRWRDPLLQAVERLRTLAAAGLLLMILSTAGVVTLAAQAALASNAAVVGTLRLIGATDGFIARTFVRRLTIRTVLGACIGTGLAVAAIALIPHVALMGDRAPRGAELAPVLLVPVVAGLAAFFSTRRTARRMLGRLQDL